MYQLSTLGFSLGDCQEELDQAQHQLHGPALWLTLQSNPGQKWAPSALATEQTSFLHGHPLRLAGIPGDFEGLG